MATLKKTRRCSLVAGLLLGLAGFAGCSTTPEKPKAGSAGNMLAVGPYRLDAPVEGLPGLVEWTEAEYQDIGRQFRGERNYNAPPVSFLGGQWRLMLGTVNGRIYRIAPSIAFSDKETATEALTVVVRFYRSVLGEPAKQQPGIYVWNAPQASVILQTAEASDGLGIQLFLTSASTQNFQKFP